MDKKTFETLARDGKLDQVVFLQVTKDEVEVKFHLLGHFAGYTGDKVYETDLGTSRKWDSLDTLFKSVRAMGYTGRIVIESGIAQASKTKASGESQSDKPPSWKQVEESRRKLLEQMMRGSQKEKEGEKPSRDSERQSERGG